MKIRKKVVKYLPRVTHASTYGQRVSCENVKTLNISLYTCRVTPIDKKFVWKQREPTDRLETSFCTANEKFRHIYLSSYLDKKFPVQKSVRILSSASVRLCVCARSSKLRQKICRLSNRTFSFLLSHRFFHRLCSCPASVYQREFAFIAPRVRAHT